MFLLVVNRKAEDRLRGSCVFIVVNVYNEDRSFCIMGQLTVRNVPDEIVRALRIRAAKHGRSAESEHRLILKDALAPADEDFWSKADALRTKSRRQRTDSGTLQREMREDR
jgi:plasmid stability protein